MTPALFWLSAMIQEKVAVTVPCYNEEKRLKTTVFSDFFQLDNNIQLIFVNDGSTDGTLEKLEEIRAVAPEKCIILNCKYNKGKGEAVRQGMLYAFGHEFTLAGFWDADLSTPLQTIHDFRGFLANHPRYCMIFGARVQMLGKTIIRSPWRHYMGRIFATFVSTALNLKVYDTQCGAKMFRVIPEIKEIFSAPFLTRWIFDVEILTRWMRLQKERNLPPADKVIYEYPLLEWRHVTDSKISLRDLLSIAFELKRVFSYYLKK
jgi:dolichyl-phosphate beta-glucosyltransferase